MGVCSINVVVKWYGKVYSFFFLLQVQILTDVLFGRLVWSLGPFVCNGCLLMSIFYNNKKRIHQKKKQPSWFLRYVKYDDTRLLDRIHANRLSFSDCDCGSVNAKNLKSWTGFNLTGLISELKTDKGKTDRIITILLSQIVNNNLF